MIKNGEKGKENNYLLLYDAIYLKDREKKKFKGKKGKNKEYEGIMLTILGNIIEDYWVTRDGKYRPNDMNIAFTNCSINEIFRGNEKYSPIEKEFHYILNNFKYMIKSFIYI